MSDGHNSMNQRIDPAGNLASLASEINKACQVATRDCARAPVTIVAVSKKHTADRIQPALDCGHRVFGENRVQEALSKWPVLKEQVRDVRLHLIGPLQSNKAKEAVAFFDVIETVDRPKIARAIASEIQHQGRAPTLLIQINTGEEPQKAGIAPRDADSFIAQCRNEFGLAIGGLMCIPPHDGVPGPHFALLDKIARAHNLPLLSMGMSADYLTAVKLGATHVRLGTAIFGARTA